MLCVAEAIFLFLFSSVTTTSAYTHRHTIHTNSQTKLNIKGHGIQSVYPLWFIQYRISNLFFAGDGCSVCLEGAPTISERFSVKYYWTISCYLSLPLLTRAITR